MNRQLTYSVIADGGTDRLLIPIIQWAIFRLDPGVEILEPRFRKRRGSVRDFLHANPIEDMLIFVHRDSETQSLEQRLSEFESMEIDNVVPIVPVRMSEAWILFNSEAIAMAADSPANSSLINVPKLTTIESIADPKSHLDALIVKAAGNPTGRRGKVLKKSMKDRRMTVASHISDFSPLEQLSAFRAFQESLAERYPYRHLICE